MRRVLFVAAMAAILAVALAAQVNQVNIDALGPRAGDRAIAFDLPDQSGHHQTLASVAGPNGTMLVFFRSADW